MRVTARCPVRIDFAGAWTDVDLYSSTAGGAVVNAAIDQYVHGCMQVGEEAAGEGVRVEYSCELPPGSGLGASSAMNVCWLGLLAGQTFAEGQNRRARIELAERAYRLEELLGVIGGRQDQLAAALGGFNYLTFGPGDPVQVSAEPLAIAPDLVAELERRLVLCYTGGSRLSSDVHEKVWAAYRREERATVEALRGLREGADRMRAALADMDLDSVGELISESWRRQRALDASVTNEQIEMLFAAAARAGAEHGKACGAGGGGCLLFYAMPGTQDAVREALVALRARLIPFRFTLEGAQVRIDA